MMMMKRSNDVFDHDKDTDKGKAESVVNLTGNRTACFWASFVFFVIGIGTFFQLTSAAVRMANSSMSLLLACCSLYMKHSCGPDMHGKDHCRQRLAFPHRSIVILSYLCVGLTASVASWCD